MTTFADPLAGRILTNRGRRGVLDADLARLYGVPTKRLKEAVQRNAARFPADFALQLSGPEFAALRSQIATSCAQAVAGVVGAKAEAQLAAGSASSSRGAERDEPGAAGNSSPIAMTSLAASSVVLERSLPPRTG
jgi:hypothetical protein